MKQTITDTYNIAWFKLAECVSRGEKERALGVYRLLAHSLNDDALAAQLKGDILLTFNVQEALERYEEAATLYIRSNRINKATYVYEHLLTLQPHNKTYRSHIQQLQAQLRAPSTATV